MIYRKRRKIQLRIVAICFLTEIRKRNEEQVFLAAYVFENQKLQELKVSKEASLLPNLLIVA